MPAKKKKPAASSAEETYKLALLGAITLLLIILFAWYHSVQPRTSYSSGPTIDKTY